MRIALVSGGTGGHIFPAISLKEELKKYSSVEKITFLVTVNPLSKWVLEDRKEDIVYIPSRGFSGKGLYKKLIAVLYTAGGLFRSLFLLKKDAPDIACGFGGYGAFPYLAACHMRGIPFVLHEQNLIPGKTTRFLSRFSREVLTSFPDCKNYLPKRDVFFTGNFCRKEFVYYHRSLESCGYKPDEKKVILVIGGSQGSHFLNQNLPQSLLKILQAFPGFSLVHISGDKEKQMVEEMYRPLPSRAKVMGFSRDVLSLIKEARIVISRAGATMISELCLCGVPSILIPFAGSADNHQHYNALWLKERGGALMIEEKDFTKDFFYHSLKEILASASKLKDMSSRLLKLAQPDAATFAAKKIIELCVKV